MCVSTRYSPIGESVANASLSDVAVESKVAKHGSESIVEFSDKVSACCLKFCDSFCLTCFTTVVKVGTTDVKEQIQTSNHDVPVTCLIAQKYLLVQR